MARFIFMSDLHCDHAPLDVPATDLRGEVDAVLVAGDINERGACVGDLNRIWDAWGVPVLAIPGNHDLIGPKRFDKYLSRIGTEIAQSRAAGRDVEFSTGVTRVFGDTRVIAATLWTDHRLGGENLMMTDMALTDRNFGMAEYRGTFWKDEARCVYRRMTPADTRSLHNRDLAFIISELDRPHDGPTIVMTHHLPTPDKLAEAGSGSFAYAYASDISAALSGRSIDVWICGHSHAAPDILAHLGNRSIPVVSNCRGLPAERLDFDMFRVLDSADPEAAMRGRETCPEP